MYNSYSYNETQSSCNPNYTGGEGTIRYCSNLADQFVALGSAESS